MGLKIFLLFLCLHHQPSFSQKPIDTSEIITLGGIKQYVQIKGDDNSKPILLFLHGGPGSSLLQKSDKISGKLRQQFVVVHWDQRETGKTLKLNKSSQPLRLDLFYDDTHDLIDTLLKQFRKSKLYLAGYSWGSVLGFYIANKYPELLFAYLAISPVIDQSRSDSLSLKMLKETMGKKAQDELSQVKIPFENWEQLYFHRKWLMKHEGQKSVSRALPKSYVQSWAATWFDVWLQASTINLVENLHAINCPVYFFAGQNDYNTNHSITEEYFKMVRAPKKDFFLFPQAGHGLPETDSELFQNLIIEKILPTTFSD